EKKLRWQTWVDFDVTADSLVRVPTIAKGLTAISTPVGPRRKEARRGVRAHRRMLVGASLHRCSAMCALHAMHCNAGWLGWLQRCNEASRHPSVASSAPASCTEVCQRTKKSSPRARPGRHAP